MKLHLLVLLLLVSLISGCVEKRGSQPGVDANALVEKCVSMCKSTRQTGENLSAGPCLSNNLSDGWVCDVAHWPRQAMDNDRANQCPSYGKTANAFVEVDPNCRPIRYYSPETGMIMLT